MRGIRWCAVVGLAFVLTADPAAAQDDHAVKTLYEAARYQEALAEIDRVDTSSRQPSERARLLRYRALCLVGVNRPADADAALEEMIRQAPLAAVDDPGVSPAMQQRIARMRARILPVLAQAAFARGREEFDRRAFARAIEEFTVSIALADASGDAQTLIEWRTLAVGFRDLASAMLAAQPPAPEQGMAPPRAPWKW